jgi:hypothetical protein
MAKVKLQKAAKDYPAQGIKKGQSYYYARIKTGPRSSKEIRSLTPIPRGQLTSSAFLSAMYDLEDRLAAVTGPLADLEATLDEIATDVRALGEEEREKYDNMPEGLQQGSTGELLDERANGMEEWADSIEQAAQSVGEKIETFDEANQPWIDYDRLEPEVQANTDEPEDDRPDEEEVVQEILGEIDSPSCG